ncbi:MAG: malate synthase A, partial [Actinomycetota bacterium]|nr:malate synthase A [Actinomycetota bacterium]
AKLDDGTTVDRELVERIEQEELEKIREEVGEEVYAKSRADDAVALFEKVSMADDFIDFLTLPAYDLID